MANSGLIALGILLIGGMFFFTNILVTPQQRSQIELGSSICSSPLGQLGGALSGEVAEKCQQAQTYSQITSIEIPVYLIGFIILVIGLVIGNKKKEITKEVIREPSEKHETEEKEKKPKKKEIKSKVKYCTNCGTRVKGKFCSKCGEPI